MTTVLASENVTLIPETPSRSVKQHFDLVSETVAVATITGVPRTSRHYGNANVIPLQKKKTDRRLLANRIRASDVALA